MKRRRGRIAELLATLIVIGMWVVIAAEVSQAMSTSAQETPAAAAAAHTTTAAAAAVAKPGTPVAGVPAAVSSP